MIKNNYFAHTSPAGIAPWHWFDENKYDYKYAGENLALGFSSVESEHQAWMDSPTHKKNILNPNFKEIGIAVGKGTIDNNLVTIAVQEFGAKMENGVFKKEENNISDDKSKDLLKENKDNNKGIVLNTESSDSNNKLDSLIKDKGSEPKISFSRIKEFLSQNGNSSAWITLITIISLCIIVNTLAALMLVFHNLINHMRKEPDIFKVVHGLLILLLVGSIIF